MMLSPNACNYVTLTNHPMAHVERCTECGAIAVHFGPFTIRIDEQGLAGLLTSLREASARLNHTERLLERVPSGEA